MQERQVTIGDEELFPAATLLGVGDPKPLEQEGTYPLPEAQTDRFLMKVLVDYPSQSEERQILDRALSAEKPQIDAVLTIEALSQAKEAVRQVFIDDRLKDYCVALVRGTVNAGAVSPELIN